ncbi:AbgT family transporter [Geomicrobium sp. JSM 1781026]|uniref:AbgT family transporter n=1 Tax=Geomicrobium sp. JSM 1781026 TaxID=3344580 RepID=UPI0035BF06A5
MEGNRLGNRALDTIEKLGNKLPHPFMLFVYFIVAIILTSFIISFFDVAFQDPESGDMIEINNMLSADGIEYIFSSMLDNFTGFTPLGTVLSLMLGIGLAQKVGLMESFMKKTITNAPKQLVTYAVVFAGILGNLASDAAFVIIPPLAAMVFYSIGRHPVAGLAAGFAGVGAGFTANFLITGTDALLAGVSTEVAQTINEDLFVTPVDNYFFMVVSVFMLIFVAVWITEKVTVPRLGKYDPKYAEDGVLDQKVEEITPEINRGLRNALIAGALYIGVAALLILPPNAILRADDGSMVPSPFFDNIVPINLLFFLVVSITYGVTVKEITAARDVPEKMAAAMKDMSGFIVLIFAASQFIAYFDYTNIGAWIAVSGASALESMNFTGLPVIVLFILFTTMLNMFIFSGSAQWALMAPVFIPLFVYLNYDPAYIQLAYRIGDSSTNIITPMNPYVPMVLAFLKQYDTRAGFGTLFSIMIPYTIVILTLWIIMFVVWSLLGLPIGPGSGMHIQ